MNGLSELLLALIAALGVITSTLIQRLLNHVDDLSRQLFIHCTDEDRHVSKDIMAKLLSQGVLGLSVILFLITLGCIKDPVAQSKSPAAIPSVREIYEEPTSIKGAIFKTSSQRIVADNSEVEQAIKWSAVLLALGIIGLFLPSFLFSKTEGLIALSSALLFFLLVKWSTILASVVRFVVPVVLISLIVLVAYRIIIKKKKG